MASESFISLTIKTNERNETNERNDETTYSLVTDDANIATGMKIIEERSRYMGFRPVV